MSNSKGAAIDEILERVASKTVDSAIGIDSGALDLETGQRWILDAKEEAKQAILALLAQEVKRIIGEDEPLMGDVTGNNFFTADQDDLIKDRNRLRAEQRRKAGLV